MLQIIQKEQEIADLFLNDTAQGDWIIKLDKTDYEAASNHSKPTIAVKAEDDKSLAELSAMAFDEIKKTGCVPTSLIVMVTFRQDNELMMMEMGEFNDCLSTYIDNDTDFKWGVQSVSDMLYKRRITIIGFTKKKQKLESRKLC